MVVFFFKLSMIMIYCFHFIYAKNNPFQINFLELEKNHEALVTLLENEDDKLTIEEQKEQKYMEELSEENKRLEKEIEEIVSRIELKKDEELVTITKEEKKLQKIKKRKARKKCLALQRLKARKKRALARKHIYVKVRLSRQRIYVYRGKKLLHAWKISTGKKGYATPKGFYRPLYIERMHLSKKYHNAPMPYAVFFRGGGYAIHGTRSVSRLGRKASHGCIRLRTSHARQLYFLVKKSGKNNTDIRIMN